MFTYIYIYIFIYMLRRKNETGVVAGITKIVTEHGGHITQSKSMELGMQVTI